MKEFHEQFMVMSVFQALVMAGYPLLARASSVRKVFAGADGPKFSPGSRHSRTFGKFGSVAKSKLSTL